MQTFSKKQKEACSDKKKQVHKRQRVCIQSGKQVNNYTSIWNLHNVAENESPYLVGIVDITDSAVC